jgi:hypothetical protein
MTSNVQSQNVNKQLREVTELINTYQQKITLLNEEIDILKQQLNAKDKDLEQYRIQLKNLKRSRSNESSQLARHVLQLNSNNNNNNNNQENNNNSSEKFDNIVIYSSNSKYTKDDNVEIGNKSGTDANSSGKGDEQSNSVRNKRAQSVDSSSDNQSKQIEMAKDEIKLLRNKIARLEDDLSHTTQVRFIDIFIFF